MEQLLLHLLGDYITQTDRMAKNKTTSIDWAIVHGVVYAVPFALVFDMSVNAWLALCGSHILIDRYCLARYVIFAKNWLTDRTIVWADYSTTGYHKDTPPWLAFWLMIIADNTLHLAINYAAIRWL